MSIICRKAVVILLMAFFTTGLTAQTISDIRITSRTGGEKLATFFDGITREYGIRFFVKQEWIDTVTVGQTYYDIPLVRVLNSLFQHTNLTWRFFQDDAVIVFPREGGGTSHTVEEMELLVIGDPLNLGKFRSVTLKGKIVNGKTGDPLPGAAITDMRTGKGTVTDRLGNYTIQLATGDYTLAFSYLGFQPGHQKIRLIENGYSEFELFEESHAIGEVTVTADYADLPHAQMSLVRMDTKAMKDIPALMGEVDLVRTLTMQPGIQSVGELSSGFNVRGGNTDQNLFLVNGTPLFNSSHLFGFLSLVNPDLVENVRLFKGGLPARMGERVSSVIEVDLKEGNEENIRIYGGLGILNSRVAIDGPLSENKNLRITAGGRSSYSDWLLKMIPNPAISRSEAGFYDAAVNLTLRYHGHDRLSASVYVSDDKFNTSAWSLTRYGNFTGNLQSRIRFSDKTSGEGNASFSRYNYRQTDMAGGKSNEAYHFLNGISCGSLRYNLRFTQPAHAFETGFNLVYYLNNPGMIAPVNEPSLILRRKLPREKAAEGAIYFSDEIAISPVLSLSAGLRLSGFTAIGTPVVYRYDDDIPSPVSVVADSITFRKNERVKSYGNPEPRLLLRYDISPEKIFRFNLQRTSQYIFQISNNAVISPAETWKTSDYHQLPLLCDQVAIGYDRYLRGKNLELSTEVYFKKLTNLVEYRDGATLIMNPRIETCLIPARGFSAGIELMAKKTAGRLTGWISYMYSKTMRKTTGNSIEEMIRKGRYYPSVYDKPHDLTAAGTYHISRRWRMSADFTYISGRPVTLPEQQFSFAGETLIYYSERNKYRMPPYHRLDFSVTLDENLRKKRTWKGSWTFAVYNAYGRNNPYSVYFRKTIPDPANGYRTYSLFRLSVIGAPVPSLTYNFKF